MYPTQNTNNNNIVTSRINFVHSKRKGIFIHPKKMFKNTIPNLRSHLNIISLLNHCHY